MKEKGQNKEKVAANNHAFAYLVYDTVMCPENI
jgi:hypothetical protein